jgi:hypothetical protein
MIQTYKYQKNFDFILFVVVNLFNNQKYMANILALQQLTLLSIYLFL